MLLFLAVLTCLSVMGCGYAAFYPMPEVVFIPSDISRISLHHKDNTIPFVFVILFAAILQYFLIAVYSYLYSLKRRCTFLLLFSFICTQLFVMAPVKNMKIIFRRHRPDFYDRCMPVKDGRCTGNPKLVWDGLKSMPSGHTAQTF